MGLIMNDKVEEHKVEETEAQDFLESSTESSVPEHAAEGDSAAEEARVVEETPTAEKKPAMLLPVPQQTGQRISWFSPWLIVAVLALGLAGWQWMETRARLTEMQQALDSRLAESDGTAKQSQTLALQSQEQLATMQAKLDELAKILTESKSQQDTLESLYQNLLTRHSEESMLIDVEQSVTLAAEQLQLAGNVQGAVLALQTIETRLADGNQLQFIGLRKALSSDLERLRALPQMDLPGMFIRLENVIIAIDSLPLATIGQPSEDESPPPLSSEPERPSPAVWSMDYWRLLATDLWKEVRGLIQIRRIDHIAPVFLAPEQTFFLRENLKLRLLNARLALLSRDQWTYRNELQQAQDWLTHHFDMQDPAVQKNRQALEQLSAVEISYNLPNLNESLSAIKSFRADRERNR